MVLIAHQTRLNCAGCDSLERELRQVRRENHAGIAFFGGMVAGTALGAFVASLIFYYWIG